MKKIFFYLIGLSSIIANNVNAAENALGVDDNKLRNGDFSFSDIPKIIQSVTNYVLSIAASIAVIMVIVGGLKYSLGSVEGSSPNKQKAQDTIKFGITGFVIAISSWFIINLIIANF